MWISDLCIYVVWSEWCLNKFSQGEGRRPKKKVNKQLAYNAWLSIQNYIFNDCPEVDFQIFSPFHQAVEILALSTTYLEIPVIGCQCPHNICNLHRVQVSVIYSLGVLTQLRTFVGNINVLVHAFPCISCHEVEILSGATCSGIFPVKYILWWNQNILWN